MADDLTVDNGGLTDYDVATDDDGSGNHVQIVKLAQAADGSRTAIPADSDGMLVNLGANNDVTVTGTVDLGATDNAVLDAILAALASVAVTNGGLTELAAAINASRVDVNLAASAATVTVDGSGVTQPVSGTVTANLSAVDNAVLDSIVALLTTMDADTGALVVDLAAIETLLTQIDADTSNLAAILTALQLIDNAISGNEMQVDVVSSALPTGAATAAKQPALGTAGTPSTDVISIQGVASGTVVPVSDGGGVLTVDGTVTANLSAVDNAVLDAIELATEATQAALETVGGLVVNLGANNDVTVTGTVTAELSATDNAVLDNIDADLTTLIGHVDGVEGLLTTIDADTGAMVTDLAALEVLATQIDADTSNISAAVATEGSALGSGVLLQGDDGTDRTNVLVDVQGHLQVDVLTAPSTAVTNAGTFAVQAAQSGAWTVDLGATDNGVLDAIAASLALLDNAIATGNELQVDVVGALPAGDNNIGNVDAIQSGTWTVELGATDNAVLDSIDADLTTIIGHVDGIEGHVDGIEGLLTTIDGDTGAIAAAVAAEGAALGSGVLIQGDDGTDRTNVLVDTDGHLQVDVLTGGGGGTQYTEGDTDASITGTAILWEDAGDTLVPASAANPFPVEIIAGAGSGGTAAADDADFTAGTTSGTPAMGVYQSTPGNVTDGDLGIVGITQDRALRTVVEGSVAVTGTVDLGATDNAVLDAIDADLTTLIGHVDGVEALLTTIDADTGGILTAVQTLDNAISGNEMQVDVVTSALPSGAATEAKQDTAITALQLLDDAVYVDDADWTDATSKHLLVGGLYQSTPQTVTDGDVAPFNITANGALHVADGGGSLTVDGTITANLSATDNQVLDNIDADLTTIIGHVDGIEGHVDGIETLIGTTNATLTTIDGRVDGIEGLLTTIDADTGNLAGILTAVQLIDNPVAVLGTATYTEATSSGMIMGAVRRDADTTLVNTTNEIAPLQVDANGRLKVEAFSGETLPVSLASVPSHAVTNAGTFVVQENGAALTALQLIDNASANHDAAVASGITQIGLDARSSEPTAVASGDAVRALSTLLGKQVVLPYAIPASTWSYAAASGGITNTTAVTFKASAGAGVRNYITHIDVVNAHATVSTEVLIRDGAGGTVLWRGYCMAGGGGYSINFDNPLRGTAATLLEVVNVTTGAAVYFNATGFVAAE